MSRPLRLGPAGRLAAITALAVAVLALLAAAMVVRHEGREQRRLPPEE